MLKLITSNKVVEGRKDWNMHPEITIGMNKISKWLQKKAQAKEETIVFTFNPILFRIGLLLKLQGEKVSFGYMNSKTKIEEVQVDYMGYFINPSPHFMDMMEKIQDQIVDIRKERRYNNDR